MSLKRYRFYNNEEASAGGLAGLAILFMVCALFIALLTPVVDKMGDANNDIASVSAMPVSQDRMTTMEFLQDAFAIMGFMILLAAGINYWVNSIREQSSEV